MMGMHTKPSLQCASSFCLLKEQLWKHIFDTIVFFALHFDHCYSSLLWFPFFCYINIIYLLFFQSILSLIPSQPILIHLFQRKSSHLQSAPDSRLHHPFVTFSSKDLCAFSPAAPMLGQSSLFMSAKLPRYPPSNPLKPPLNSDARKKA